MITTPTSPFFSSGADVLVNAVNCVGVMGKGIALEFKQRFPVNYQAYRSACTGNIVRLGSMYVTHGSPTIVNFPTKRHWRDPSKIEWIEAGLIDLRRILDAQAQGLVVAMPALGCQNGGLDWEIVRPLIVDALSSTSHQILLYGPGVR